MPTLVDPHYLPSLSKNFCLGWQNTRCVYPPHPTLEVSGGWKEILEYWLPKPVTLFCPRLGAVTLAILAGVINWPVNTNPKLCPSPLLQKWENQDRQFPNPLCSWGCAWHKILAEEMWVESSGEASLPLLPFPLVLPWTWGVINGAATAVLRPCR